MSRSLARSNAHFEKALAKLPLGVSSNFRYWGDDKTLYVDHGKGARLWDIDGNEYIDYRLGYGPAILGYAEPRVDAAVREALAVGGVFALATEAVMAALRLARAFTGKDAYVVIEGGYHGLFDAVLWYADVEQWQESDGGDPQMLPYSEGVPHLMKRLMYSVPLNDAQRLEDLFRKYARDISAILVEPIMGNCCGINATPEYMRAVRELCDRYEVLLIVDEVKTGFRVARGGVQELLGIKADLCTFAKAMANGYPISALAGREDLMRLIGDTVAHGGTYTAHGVSLAAAETTLRILDETPALSTIAAYGLQLKTGMSAILSARGIAHSFTGHDAMFGLFFAEEPPGNYRDWVNSDYSFYDTMAPELHDLGVLCEPDSREPWFICEAHDPRCLSHTLQAFDKAVDLTTRKMARGESVSGVG